MADVLTSNLYPPIMDTFMPAFTGNSCKVYFDFSDFNTASDINTNLIQVTVVNQKSNVNSLNQLNGIRFYTLQSEDNRYYIEINSSHLKNGFAAGEYYKVQIRFTQKDLNYPVNNYDVDSAKIPAASWINDNVSLFSEWSSVCLIRKITQPALIDNTFTYLNNEYKYDYRLLRYNGTINFPNPNEGEYLSEYKLTLKHNNNNGIIIEESGIQYPQLDNNKNKILYNFKKRLDASSTYYLAIDITTNNGYEETFSYTFTSPAITNASAPIVTVNSSANSSNNGHGHQDLSYTDAIDQGRMKIQLEAPSGYPNGNYYIAIYRSSHRSNFQDWDEIGLARLIKTDENGNSTVFFDYAIESGVWYKYIGQIIDSNGNYGLESIESPAETVLYEDVFLNSQGKQLKLRFDSHITSYKKAVMESKVETLGSTYPFVRRNSNTNYKTFQITGLISYLSDDGEIFLTEDEIYGGSSSITEKYHEYNLKNGISPQADYVKEREFREKVIDFLCSGKVFLLRTLTEGLALVRLMEINFTPKQELGNYIYNFTATAIEVADCTPENYYKHKVFPWYYSTIQLER